MEQILVLYRFSIEGSAPEFEAAYRDHWNRQLPIEGYRGEWLTRNAKAPAEYTVVSWWEPAAFQRWLRSPAHAEIAELLRSFGVRVMANDRQEVITVVAAERLASAHETRG